MTTQFTARAGDSGGLNVRRMSARAYNSAVRAAREGHAVAAEDGEVWDELEASGLADPGRMRLQGQWAQALAASSTAPVQVGVTARQGPVTFTTDIVLLPGLGLACTQRSLHEGVVEDRRDPAVELVAFTPEQVWPVVRRVLPPKEVLRAAPAPTPSSRRHVTPAGGDSSREQVVADADVSVELVVTARTADGRSRLVGAHQWLVTGGRLHVLDPGGTRLTILEPGAVAHELIFLITGAHDLVASSQAVRV